MNKYFSSKNTDDIFLFVVFYEILETFKLGLVMLENSAFDAVEASGYSSISLRYFNPFTNILYLKMIIGKSVQTTRTVCKLNLN